MVIFSFRKTLVLALVMSFPAVAMAQDTELGSLTIEKQTLPDGSPQSFSFSGAINISLMDDGSASLGGILPGQYTVTEAVQSGWDLTDITCTGDDDSSGNIQTRTATFNIAAGDDVKCVFTNTQRAKITLEKTVVGGTRTQTDFQAYIDDGSGPSGVNWDDTHEVAPNIQYTASEDLYFGYTASGWGGNCAADGTVTPLPGETVTCTITNTYSGPYTGYTCVGATFADGYDVDVKLEDGWEGIWFQVEDADGPECDNFKDADADFACNKRGDGNLVTSRIDDDTDPSDGFPADFSDSADNADLDIIESGADPRYAIVHADIFQPDACAEPTTCLVETIEEDCFISASGAEFLVLNYEDAAAAAEAACEDSFAYNGEGMFAEANEGGGTISPNRPKNGNNAYGNWAMYVELMAACEAGTLWVETGEEPTCESAAFSVDAIGDGGDWDDAYIDAGTVTFTPVTDCQPNIECPNNPNNTVCE